MPDTYPVVDLTVAPSALESRPSIDPARLAQQLKDIANAIAPVVAEADRQGPFGLQSIELALTVGAEGGVWFVAKGSAEASITVKFGHDAAKD
jgi:hypothetical protein